MSLPFQDRSLGDKAEKSTQLHYTGGAEKHISPNQNRTTFAFFVLENNNKYGFYFALAAEEFSHKYL